VDKLEECRSFYQGAFGFKEEVTVEGVYYELEAGNCRLGLYKRELMQTTGRVPPRGEQAAADQVVLTLHVANVDAAYEELHGKGIEFISEPHDQEAWVLRVAHLRDPEGTLIEINSPLQR
jgi:uncharacterized glyoxalase superfamily protein PhnB